MNGYVIADITITDGELFKEYKSKVDSTIEKYNGTFIMMAKGKEGAIDVIEGDWNPKVLVIIKFESVEQAKKWYNSPEYAEIVDIRNRSSTSNLLIVEGM
jgi:uncharacterized protein (DUF1330 family)